MYHIGDFVVKTNEGVCKIKDIKSLDISGVPKDKLYLFLVPVENPTVCVYLPADGAENALRQVITEEDAVKLLDSIPDIKVMQITDEKRREKEYKDAVSRGDPYQLASVIKTIYKRKIDRENQGKKNGSVDERYFKIAEDRLLSELALVMKKTKEEIKNIILHK